MPHEHILQIVSRPGQGGAKFESGKNWRWYTPTRTALKIPFNFRIYLGETHRYQELGKAARELRSKGLSWVKVAKKLKISDKTAKKAATRGN